MRLDDLIISAAFEKKSIEPRVLDDGRLILAIDDVQHEFDFDFDIANEHWLISENGEKLAEGNSP